MENNIVIISCSIFKNELDHLRDAGKIDVPVVYLNSMLHMYPKKLQELLDLKIEKYKTFRIILLFGDCHARMVDYEQNPNISRTEGINCCEIFLGSADYHKLRKDGAFILLPEWASRWKEVFVDYMGFKTPKALNLFMTDMHKKLVYVDTGFHAINQPLLKEISENMGLPIEIYSSSINELEKKLISMIQNKFNTTNED